MYQRYAIYYTPAKGGFETAGRSWLGWCSRTMQTIPQPPIEGADIIQVTKRPSAYGFHGTLVAPFALAEGMDEAELLAEAGAISRSVHPAGCTLALSDQHGFFALRPVGENRQTPRLAAQLVRALHPLRAPPDADELARRRRARLSDLQEQNLQLWGYPYVMDDFHFHMTLTGRVKPAHSAAVRAALQKHFVGCNWSDVTVDAITVMGERQDGRFVQIARLPLGV